MALWGDGEVIAMRYKLAGGNVNEADYDIGSRLLREAGCNVSEAIRNLFTFMAQTRSVPECVMGTESDRRRAQLAAFDELEERIAATPRRPWDEGESREDIREVLESRYV